MFIITNAIFATTISPDVWYKYKLSTAGFYAVLVAKDSWFKWIVIISRGITMNISKTQTILVSLLNMHASRLIEPNQHTHCSTEKLKWTIILYNTKYHK